MSDIKTKLGRRAFFRRSASFAAGAAVATAALPVVQAVGKVFAQGSQASGDDTMAMHRDLIRALQKPIAERKWAMVIDIRKCIGCNGCTVACIAENNLPPNVMYRTVAEVEDGDYPNLRRYFMPTNCMQCENAPCIAAANKVIPGAMARRPDGIVTIDYKKMSGMAVFEAASKACPYPKSLWFDEGTNYTDGTPAVQPYEERKAKEYGIEWSRKETKGATRKCHFCTQRIDAGVLPACVTTCTGQAMYFGDTNDAESVVSKYIKKQKTYRMEAASKSEPRVFYVDDDPEQSCMKCHG